MSTLREEVVFLEKIDVDFELVRFISVVHPVVRREPVCTAWHGCMNSVPSKMCFNFKVFDISKSAFAQNYVEVREKIRVVVPILRVIFHALKQLHASAFGAN